MIKKLLDRLGSPDAISWVNFVVIFVLQMAGSTITSQVEFSDRPLEFYSIRAFVLLCLIPVFIVGRLSLAKLAQSKPRPWITLTTFVAALITTSFLFDYLLIVFEFIEEPQGFRRLITNAFGFLTASILSSLLVTYAREFSRDNQKLVSSAKSLIETRSQASERIEKRQEELVESIKAQINLALSRITGQNQAEDTLHMRALIDDVVRPISYDLARNTRSDSKLNTLEIEPKIDWLKVSAHALRTNPFHFLATPVVIGVTGAPFMISNFQIAGAAAVVAFDTLFLLLTLLAHRLWELIPASRSEGSRLLFFGFANSIFAIAVAVPILLISGFNLFEPVSMLAWMVMCNLIAGTVALVAGALELLRVTNHALSQAVDELKREVIGLNSSYRELQQRISRALHGPVQEAITAALVKLNSPAAGQDRQSLAEDLRLRIASSLQLLEAPASQPLDISRALKDLRELWSDAVDITVKLDPQDLEILISQPWTSSIVMDLVREACSNAIRHGNATRISIQIQSSLDSGSVFLQLKNNGLNYPESPRYGLGSQLFDDVCLDWTREQRDGYVVVEAKIPFGDFG